MGMSTTPPKVFSIKNVRSSFLEEGILATSQKQPAGCEIVSRLTPRLCPGQLIPPVVSRLTPKGPHAEVLEGVPRRDSAVERKVWYVV